MYVQDSMHAHGENLSETWTAEDTVFLQTFSTWALSFVSSKSPHFLF